MFIAESQVPRRELAYSDGLNGRYAVGALQVEGTVITVYLSLSYLQLVGWPNSPSCLRQSQLQ